MKNFEKALLRTMACATAVALLCSLSGDAGAGGDGAENIALVGLDNAGHSVTTAVPTALFRNGIATAFSSVHDSVLPALASTGSKAGAWRLNTLGVGVGLSGTLGLGPIVNMTLSGRLRLIFTRGAQPEYPDL